MIVRIYARRFCGWFSSFSVSALYGQFTCAHCGRIPVSARGTWYVDSHAAIRLAALLSAFCSRFGIHCTPCIYSRHCTAHSTGFSGCWGGVRCLMPAECFLTASLHCLWDTVGPGPSCTLRALPHCTPGPVWSTTPALHHCTTATARWRFCCTTTGIHCSSPATAPAYCTCGFAPSLSSVHFTCWDLTARLQVYHCTVRFTVHLTAPHGLGLARFYTAFTVPSPVRLHRLRGSIFCTRTTPAHLHCWVLPLSHTGCHTWLPQDLHACCVSTGSHHCALGLGSLHAPLRFAPHLYAAVLTLPRAASRTRCGPSRLCACTVLSCTPVYLLRTSRSSSLVLRASADTVCTRLYTTHGGVLGPHLRRSLYSLGHYAPAHALTALTPPAATATCTGSSTPRLGFLLRSPARTAFWIDPHATP